MFDLFNLGGFATYDYDKMKLGRIEPKDNNGIGVSTANTPDEGYETALLDSNGIHPVERYKTKKNALLGHKKWIKFANDKKNKNVNKLGGLTGLVENELITLKRVK